MAFIHVRHNVTAGEADIPEDSLRYWGSKGFEPYTPPDPEEVAEIADEATLSMRRADLDTLAERAGVPEPEALASKQDVIDAIDEANNNQSSPDDAPSEEDI